MVRVRGSSRSYGRVMDSSSAPGGDVGGGADAPVAPVLRWIGRLGGLAVVVALTTLAVVGVLAHHIGPVPLCFQDCTEADVHDPWERERWIAVGAFLAGTGLLGVGWALTGVGRPGEGARRGPLGGARDGTGRRSVGGAAVPGVLLLVLLFLEAVHGPVIDAASELSTALGLGALLALVLARAIVIWGLLRRDGGSSRAAWYTAAPVAVVGTGAGILAVGVLGSLLGHAAGTGASPPVLVGSAVLPVVVRWALLVTCVLAVDRVIREVRRPGGNHDR